jgi:hypothetical protein
MPSALRGFLVTPPGLEGREAPGISGKTGTTGEKPGLSPDEVGVFPTGAVPTLGTVVEELARAVLDGDQERARRIAGELLGTDGEPAVKVVG